MIDYPAMSIPINSFVDPALDKADGTYNPANDKDAQLQSACEPCCSLVEVRLLTSASDTPEDFAGAPLSVQLVCRRFREEEIIGLTRIVESALQAL
jgi:amidase